ncbi:hypothetical protein AB5X33_000484 [Enterobacter hormaechei]
MKIRNFILYGLSVGLNRGIVFFLLPLAGYFLSKDDFGTFSLVIITSQLLIPLLTFNVSIVIAREFLDQKDMLNKYASYIFVLLILMAMLSILFGSGYKSFFILIVSESLLMVTITRARFFLGVNVFFLATVLKAIIFSLLFFCVYIYFEHHLHNINVFCLMLIVSNTAAILFILTKDQFINFTTGFKFSQLCSFFRENKRFFYFGILLIPHGLSQWIMSSSDRYIIKIFFNNLTLGEYSLAYAYASLFMLFISVLAITLPEYCIRQYNSYLNKKILLMFIGAMSSVYVIVFIVIYIFVLQCINFNNTEVNIFCLIYSSLFYLVMYHYCAAFHFYHKKSGFITKTTLLASIFSVIITMAFAWKGSIIGIAFSTHCSYLLYFLLIRRGVNIVNVNIIIYVVLISFIPLLIRYIHVIS